MRRCPVRSDCRICHSHHLDLVLQLEPTPIGDEFLLEKKYQPLHPIDLYQCQDCGLAQLLYEIPPEEIYKDYLYLTGSSVGLQEHFRNYAKEVSSIIGLKTGDLVVDIGSNDGTLLKEFRSLGMEVEGYEPCQAIADVARKEGIPTTARYFSRGAPDRGVTSKGLMVKPRLITANNVVANINDLDSFMYGVTDLLAPDGTFVFESFYLGDVIENMVFDFIYHEHLSAFSIKPVKALMRRFGLNLYRIDHLKTKGGSIRYYCNRYYASPNAMEVEDDGEHLYEKKSWSAFAQRIAVEREKTLQFCRQARVEKKIIAGFGACISGTTLMYHFGLGEFLSYLIDDNPAKVERYSPGIHLKVWPTSMVNTIRPDYVLALAWRFADDFQKAHPDIKVIRPLPCFQCSSIS